MDNLRRDVLYSVRALARSPGFTVVVLATLAIGIGANTAIFSVVKGILLDPLPYRDPQQLVQLHEKRPRLGRLRNVVAAPDFIDWKQNNTVFDGMSAVTGAAFTLTTREGAELIRGSRVTADFFDLLGVTPKLGRGFSADDQVPGRDRVIILNHGLWQRRFGGDPKIVGQTIALTGEPFTVVGVLPEMAHAISREAEIWQPLVLNARSSRAQHYLNVFARLKPGVTLAKARAEMDVLAARLEQQYPNENTGHGINLFSLDEEVTGGVRPALFILLGAVGLVLLVACANVANLYLARTAQRQREVSIRTALGASTGQMVRQLLTESILLSLLGGAAGVLLAIWGVHALVAADPGNLPRLRNIQVDGQVLAFTLAISILTGVLFGLAPALYTARTKISGALKEGGRGLTDGSGRSRTRRILVVAEVSLALLLTIGSGLMLQSFVRLAAVHPGFDSANVLTIDLPLMGARYAKELDRSAFVRELLNRMRQLPGVLSVGATNSLPLTGRDSGSNFVIAGRPPLPYSQQPNGRFRAVSPGYFETLRIPLRSGRFIGDQDHANAPPVVLINETMARQYWPDEDPLGKRMSLSGSPISREIAGIVGDVKHYALNGETRPEMYFPHAQQAEPFMTVVLRTAAAPKGLVAAVRGELMGMDKGQPVAAIRTLEDVLSLSLGQPRLYSALLLVFSVVALLLAALGIYGVMSFTVDQRTHEMGIRMALGARAGSVQGLVLTEGLRLALAGVALGVAGAFALTRVLGKLLYGITATDPVTFAGAALLLVGVAATACYFPARRATQVDPIIALRSN